VRTYDGDLVRIVNDSRQHLIDKKLADDMPHCVRLKLDTLASPV
jgi:hypothetical protein